MTKAHNDHIQVGGKDHGYSVRVGKHLPPSAVNLAYVHTDEMAPKKNLLITDLSHNIVENLIQQGGSDTVYPDDTFLLREINRPFYTATKNITVTDEFSVPAATQEIPTPLYYKSTVKGLFDARGTMVVPYPGGYTSKLIPDPRDYADLSTSQKDTLLYLGNKIRVVNLDSSPLSTNLKYKVQLVKQVGDGIPADAYSIVIYSNFRGSTQGTYEVRYEKYNTDGTHTSDYIEILNAYPFFSEVPKAQLDTLAATPKVNGTWLSTLNDQVYAVEQAADQRYKVYSPSQILIADNTSRPAHQFSYRIKGNLRTKLSSSQYGSMNIGIVYMNQSVYGGESLTSAIKRIYEHTLKPPYLDLANPHNSFSSQSADVKKNPTYWTVDLTMPTDYLNQYDLIILTGYGSYDMKAYNDALRTYLSNGGQLWIDNAGSGTNALSLTNFMMNIGFDPALVSTGTKAYAVNDSNFDPYALERQSFNRLYVMNQSNVDMGYAGVNPKITFGAGETASLWNTIIRYTSNDPCVMTKKVFGSGRMIVSNCGIFRSLLNKDTDDIRFAMNTILTIAENRYVSSPWLQQYVYHRDNLFRDEYRHGDMDAYVDSRSDLDATQIVAKKVLNKTVRDALIPYMPSSYYKAGGTFSVDVQADSQMVVANNDFEVGTYDASTGNAVTNWTASQTAAIPGWDAVVGSGTTTFTHTSSVSERGTKAVSLTSTDQSYWATAVKQLTTGTYKMKAWLKTSSTAGNGAAFGVYQTDGTLISKSTALTGAMDWTQVELTFGITATMDVGLRLGFLETGDSGTAWIDFIELYQLGSVYMTPANDGSSMLYAYAVRPKSDSFDLNSQGFTSADITVYDPQIQIHYTIRAFVYSWDNTLLRYVRQYGNYKTYTAIIRRSDGIVNLGLLTTLLPGLSAGPDWANRDQVFFEVSIGSINGVDNVSKFVNVGFFNKSTGSYFYTEAGENIIGYTDLFSDNNSLSTVLQAWTDYYTIRATKRRYAVMAQGDDRIYLEYPATIDSSDPWFVRIHNGSFTKSQLNFYEQGQFASKYNGRSFGIHQYALPEYDRQLFKPVKPYHRIRKEVAEYVDENTIRVQNAPLYVQSGQSRSELLTCLDGATKTIFKAQHGDWSASFIPTVYVDNGGNGVFVSIIDGYSLDMKNGLVIFSSMAQGNVKVDYNYNNLEVFKRTYGNAKIRREALQTSDKKTFTSAQGNWMMYPSPVVYRLPYGAAKEEQFIAPVSTYTINYDAGLVTFQGNVNDQVFADYTFSTDKQVSVKDVDTQSGLIYLGSGIDFKDELYVNYSFEQHFVEYHGFYDDGVDSFVHLDLNPAEGHYCTLPVVRTDGFSGAPMLSYEQVPTAKLMNKEVYIYIVPRQDSFGNVRNYTIRHCYSAAEWAKIQNTMPGIAQLLGVIQLREHTQIEKAVVLDTRVRGGGLQAKISRDQVKNTDQNSLSFWDMGPWDGMAYYKNGVLIIQLPSSILKTNGGQLSEQGVTDIVRKYVAFGVYFILEYMDDDYFTRSDLKTTFIQGSSFPMITKED